MVMLGSLVVAGIFTLSVLKWLTSLRRVVSTNEVHILQSRSKTLSYGKDKPNGNVYYAWPSWIPVFGISTTVLPVSNFQLTMEYEAFDSGRLPFVVDLTAFFAIEDTNVAAQKISSFEGLKQQLSSIVQGAVRTVFASNNIDEIMAGRDKFGNEFTNAVKDQLLEWGVRPVKNIELMDIRDGKGTQVIQNIMEKKKSHIQMESRTEVAKNNKMAEIAEIAAKREVDLQKQEAQQTVGLRTIEAQKQVELQQQAKIQFVKEQEKITKQKEMEVLSVDTMRKAEIDRQAQTVTAQRNKDIATLNAEAAKNAAVLAAEAEKETNTLRADGLLALKTREAQGIQLEGTARADAETAMQMAPVQAQITLAKEIGENQSYQQYLITIRQVEAQQAVGVEQAKALEHADVKVISNTGNPTEGLKSVMDLFSSRGGTELGSMLTALGQTETGAALIEKFAPALAPKPDTAKKALNGNGKAIN